MAIEKKSVLKKKQVSPVAGKLFGLTRDPVRKFNYECFHLVTATVNEEGEIVDVTKSEQSWLIWEALHKMERATEESLINLMESK